MPCVERKCSHDGAVQRIAAAGLRPPPLPVLIEGALGSVNAFQPPRNRKLRPGRADKVLMRLNFLCRPANGWRRSGRGSERMTDDPRFFPTCGALAAGRRIYLHGL